MANFKILFFFLQYYYLLNVQSHLNTVKGKDWGSVILVPNWSLPMRCWASPLSLWPLFPLTRQKLRPEVSEGLLNSTVCNPLLGVLPYASITWHMHWGYRNLYHKNLYQAHLNLSKVLGWFYCKCCICSWIWNRPQTWALCLHYCKKIGPTLSSWRPVC